MLFALFAALADEPKKFPVVKPGGTIFTSWGIDLSEGAEGANEFALDRAYLFLKADLSADVAARITLDADRLSTASVEVPSTDPKTGDPTTTEVDVDGDTKIRVFIKHAYLEYKVPKSGIFLRGGITDTAWAPYYDGFVGLRWLGKSAADQHKFVSTADAGLQAHGEHLEGLLGWQAGIINGEGFSKLEVDASKTLQARVTVDPLAKGGKLKLPVSGFVSQDVAAEEPMTLYGGAVGFKMPYLTAWGEYLGKAKGGENESIVAATLKPSIPKVAFLVARYDLYTTDTTEHALAVGLGRDWLEKVSTAITFERSWDAEEASQGVYVRAQAGF